jgi:dTDP-4-dehydrorhamnose reductase
MKSIIVTGANGQLGQELFALHSHFPSYRFHFLNRIDLDISCETEVRNLFADLRPDYCINCAAYTAVDKAEAEKKLAFEINATAVGYLAKASAFYNTRLIHISTDYVFDGTANSPYKEDHPTNPVGVYGASKLAGEQLCLQADPSCIIIRTSWVYSAFGNNFVKTMIRLMHSKKKIEYSWGPAGFSYLCC